MDQYYFFGECFQDHGRTIRRSVVHDDKLEIVEGLSQNTSDCLSDVWLTVEYAHYHTYSRHNLVSP